MENFFVMSDEVLRSVANLNSNNDPNWITLKKWIAEQLIHYENYTAFGVQLEEKEVRRYQGVSVFLFNLCSWIENAREEMASRAKIAEARKNPEPIKES